MKHPSIMLLITVIFTLHASDSLSASSRLLQEEPPDSDSIPTEVIEADTPEEIIGDGPKVPDTGADTKAPVEVQSIEVQPSPGIGVRSRVENKLNEARRAAAHGAAVYFSGLVLEYGVATPLTFTAVFNNEPGLAIASLGAGAVSTALQIAGPIRNGVGASMAYDASKLAGLGMNRNINWSFYRAGWVFNVFGILTGLIGNFIPEQEAALPLAFVNTGLALTGDIMWIISVSSSLAYTSKAKDKAGISRMNIAPVIAGNDGAGVMISFRF